MLFDMGDNAVLAHTGCAYMQYQRGQEAAQQKREVVDGNNHVGAPVMGQFDGLKKVFMKGE